MLKNTVFSLLGLVGFGRLAWGFQTTMPLHGCTFYKPKFISHFGSCADFSSKLGRNRCKKTKGSPPFMTTYPGDHVRMWLPDFFIEVTKHAGQSLFAESLDGQALKVQLQTVRSLPLKNGSESSSSGDSFWYARLLGVPYGALANSFPPVPPTLEGGIPACFKGISEFYNDQWNLNLADAPYAAAFAPVGASMCLSPAGATAFSPEIKKSITGMSGNPGTMSENPGIPCAVPVTGAQALAINALPTSEPARTLASPSRLCMGTWGNLIPRTGWIPTEDLTMSALMAAFKFQSLTSDLQLSPDLAPRTDDKWQVVFPPQVTNSCFTSGSVTHIPPGDLGRERDELVPGGLKKHHTYVIAVWRQRDTCEEPMPFEARKKAYQVNFEKNKTLCQAVGGL